MPSRIPVTGDVERDTGALDSDVDRREGICVPKPVSCRKWYHRPAGS